MGQAKQRGSREARIAQSQSRQLRQEPINIPCKSCGEPLNGFELLRHGPAGAAWQKTCKCGAVTTALVQADYSPLDRTTRMTLAMAEEIAGPAKSAKDKGPMIRPVSVDFLEKGVDTIETGLVRL